jgi:peptidoglycan/xylan/chitin deacetylase (PgdA/CDA1 family)
MLRSLAIRCMESATRLGGGRQRLLVLIYHRVLPAPDVMYPYDPDAASFRRQMQALRADFTVLPLGTAIERMARGGLPARAVAVTFDDGFADNVTVALPILRETGVPATFFIATGYLGRGWMFNDGVIEACRRAPAGTWSTGIPGVGAVGVTDGASRRQLAYRVIAALKYLEPDHRRESAGRLLDAAGAEPPRELMMSERQLRELAAAGMEIGGHTRHHPILARLADTAAEEEIAGGRSDLVAITGAPVTLFAYPNGEPGRDYGARDVALVRRLGFRAAVSTAWGFADPHSDSLQLPRVGSWGASAWRYSARIALARRGPRGATCPPVQVAAGSCAS